MNKEELLNEILSSQQNVHYTRMVHLYMQEHIYNALKSASAQAGMSMNQFVIKILEYLLSADTQKSTNNVDEDVDKIYSKRDAQKILNVSEVTILRYIHTGQLKATKVGGKWRITREDLDAFLQERGI